MRSEICQLRIAREQYQDELRDILAKEKEEEEQQHVKEERFARNKELQVHVVQYGNQPGCRKRTFITLILCTMILYEKTPKCPS